jgi:hypothetical protein
MYFQCGQRKGHLGSEGLNLREAALDFLIDFAVAGTRAADLGNEMMKLILRIEVKYYLEKPVERVAPFGVGEDGLEFGGGGGHGRATVEGE